MTTYESARTIVPRPLSTECVERFVRGEPLGVLEFDYDEDRLCEFWATTTCGSTRGTTARHAARLWATPAAYLVGARV